jgi:putative endonuclease
VSRVSEGKLGEKATCLFLSKKGYKIIERNWHCRLGEIDIVAYQGSTLIFVEVKMRSSSLFGNPYEYIDSEKLRKLKVTIESYLHFKGLENVPWRLDGVSIIKDKGVLHFQHFQGILPA